MATATLKEAYIPLPGGGKAIYGSSGTLSYHQREDGTGNVRIISTPTKTLSSSVEIAGRRTVDFKSLICFETQLFWSWKSFSDQSNVRAKEKA